MYPQHRDDNLPEVHRPEQSHKYSLPEQSPLYSAPALEAPHHVSSVNTKFPSSNQKGKRRWWVLPLVGLLIALIAGLVGGVIGQAIQKGLSAAPTWPSPASTTNSPSAITPPLTNCNSSATPSPSPGTLGTITVAQTGCNFPASRERRRLSNTTLFTKSKFTTVCNSGWVNYGLIGLLALTPSDCMEACIQYNKSAQDQERPSSERSCVGGGFIPSWTDQKLGAQMGDGQPFNCFLQSSVAGIIPNDRENAGVEIVALCLDGKCNGAGVS